MKLPKALTGLIVLATLTACGDSTKGRAFLTVNSAEIGAKAIFTEKPMAFTLAEADQMVQSSCR